MKHSTLIKPDWAYRSDREIDISDVYVDEIDPENEQGAVVTAFMVNGAVKCWDNRGDFNADGFHLTGISIETENETTFHDRDGAATLLGVNAIWRVEQHEMEAVA